MGRDERAANRLVHAYFDVDVDVLLDIADKDLPTLIEKVELLLKDVADDGISR